MPDKMETVQVIKQYCDFCELPQTYPIHVCSICKKEMCSRGESNGSGHAAYTILRLSKVRERPGDDDDNRTHLRVCKSCVKVVLNMPVGELFAGMMQDVFSFEPFIVRKGC